MMDVIEWIIQNKEWLFGGVGVAIIGFILSKNSARNYLTALFNYKSNITQINIEQKEDEKK